MRVVFTVLDALPARHMGPDHTPVLDELAHAGARAPNGARSVMTSATYPNHATFVTGAEPNRHGIGTNWVPQTGRVVPAWKRGPSAPTLFDACAAAGRSTAAVFGDQHLVGVTGATVADHHWPQDGRPPDDLILDAMGYLEDRDTVAEILRALDPRPTSSSRRSTAPTPRHTCTGPTATARSPATARPTRGSP